jgi:hypothetical protein
LNVVACRKDESALFRWSYSEDTSSGKKGQPFGDSLQLKIALVMIRISVARANQAKVGMA